MRFLVLLLTSSVFCQANFAQPTASVAQIGARNEKITARAPHHEPAADRQENIANADGTTTVRTYGADGVLRRTETYRDVVTQVRHGASVEWYANGQKKLYELYDNGLLLHRQMIYPNGQIKLQERYVEGELVSGLSYTPAGLEVPYQPYNHPAEFAGGMAGLLRYFGQQVRYPVGPLAAGITGRVYVQLNIDTLGMVTRATVGRSLHPELDAEALRVARTVSFKEPAREAGHAVPSVLTVPVTFDIR